ncbi:hypothetical protein [Legionella oakridgensis]|nr:hypothetical protein [Legionella oakridgensis]ETO93970.1 hypothetical protein LOR_93c25150 [Legionella oakridgensis RV-2-2007]KTD44781.1 hypothetical protein Loak_0031 [Legionella oakridgensis]STY16124.1 Uncharacterised protein [Legionella longbeachae]
MLTKRGIGLALENEIYKNPFLQQWRLYFSSHSPESESNIRAILKGTGFELVSFYSGRERPYLETYDTHMEIRKTEEANPLWKDLIQHIMDATEENRKRLSNGVNRLLAANPTESEWQFRLESIYDRRVVDEICTQLNQEGFIAKYEEGYYNPFDSYPAHIKIIRHNAKPSAGKYSANIQPLPRRKTYDEIAREFSPEFIDFFENAFPNTSYRPSPYFFDGYGHFQLSETRQGYLFEARMEQGINKKFLIPYAYDPFNPGIRLHTVYLEPDVLLLSPQSEKMALNNEKLHIVFMHLLLINTHLNATYEVLKEKPTITVLPSCITDHLVTTKSKSKKMSAFDGCIKLIKLAVNNLLLIEPFNDVQSPERTALMMFEWNVGKKLEALMLDQSKQPKAFNPAEVRAMYNAEVNTLIQILKNQELKNKVYSVLMATCGLVLGVLAAVPLGIPLCFSSVRSYIGSFFVSPQMSAQQFQRQMQETMIQLQEVISNQIEGADIPAVIRPETSELAL